MHNKSSKNRCFHRFWLLGGFFILFLLTCSIGVTSVILFASNLSAIAKVSPNSPINPNPTLITSPAANSTSIQSITTSYYQALKDKDYGKAFTFFAENSVLTIQENNGISSKIITQDLLQKLSNQKSRLEAFSLEKIGFLPKDGSSIAQMEVKRSNSNNKYVVTITLIQEEDGWKIIGLDGV